MEQKISESELEDIKEKNGINKTNGEVEENVKPTTIPEKIKFVFNFITVEFFLFCYIFAFTISALAVQRLYMEKACRSDLNYTESLCTQVISGEEGENVTAAKTEAQILVADMASWTQPLQSAVPTLLILFVGAWSDRTGRRKPLMLIPMFGEVVSAIGLLLTIYFFEEWPLWVTGVLQAVPAALSGGLSIALMGSYSYIADITTTETRTFRMSFIASIVTLGSPIASAVSGILLKALGYYGIFAINLAIFILGILHVFFKIHDTNRVESKGTILERIIEFFHPKNAWDTISLLFVSPKKQLIQLWLAVWAHLVVIGPVWAEAVIVYLYLLQKFNMNEVEFSLFTTYTLLMSTVGISTAITLLSKILKLHDDLIGAIATTSKILASFVYAFVPTKPWLYAGPVVDFFGNCGAIVVRSLGTKIVKADEIGKVCSLFGLVEAIVQVIYPPMYTKLYSATLETLPGAFYILGGVMTTPAVFIFLILYFIHKKQEKDIVKDPDAKEMHAHDNAVTSF